ncbi:MAG: YraN family protein [Clostridia bacterium]|nr:YraN family protein [Clostridia bacterium]
MKTYTPQKVGKTGEKHAARMLRRAGYRVLARNKHFGKNELDLVVKNKQYIVFVEVKTRTAEGAKTLGTRPAEAVDHSKRRHVADAAIAYLGANPTPLCPRFDVVEVYLDRAKRLKLLKINHIIDAFSVNGKARH